MNEKGCHACHRFDDKADYLGSFTATDAEGEETVSFDSLNFKSNFSPIAKKICAECHTAENAGDHCLVCHNYHVGDFEQLMPKDVFSKELVEELGNTPKTSNTAKTSK